MTVSINGRDLSIEQVVTVARQGEKVTIDSAAYKRMEQSRQFVEELLAAGKTIYGINTGFGKLSNVSIEEQQLAKLQYNLVVSCCTGVGEPFPTEVVRAMLLLRANSLVKGYSGVRPVIVETLLAMLNKGVHPVVPQKGSVGSSGDLAPLAHLAHVLIGEGQAYYQNEQLPGKVAMQRAGIEPVTLLAKEGLSLCNGTQAMTAVGALAVYDALNLGNIADIAGALTAEALEGITAAFDSEIQEVRPHRGQTETAGNLRTLLTGSEILAGAEHGRVQDAYALRCMPQVHGASKDAICYVKKVVETEINSATDNPLVFPENGKILSGGNFHGQPVALAMDFLSIAVAELGNISERRTERLTNPALSGGLPAFLIKEGGINDGLMVAQYTAAALVSENKVLAHPASVDSIPTSANQEDHVSMGTIASRQAREIIANVQYVIAIELMCASQGLEFRTRQPSPRLRKVYGMVRELFPLLESDRALAPDIERTVALIKSGELLKALES
jgi:histidine ammonia-lyase